MVSRTSFHAGQRVKFINGVNLWIMKLKPGTKSEWHPASDRYEGHISIGSEAEVVAEIMFYGAPALVVSLNDTNVLAELDDIRSVEPAEEDALA